MNINPWLAEKILAYRNQHSDSVLRADYLIAVTKGSHLSWDQHLACRALESVLQWDPFLLTIRKNMDLPQEIINTLYLCHVDCVADLLQLSEEELAECARVHQFKMGPIKKYLKEHGYHLLHCKERTYKLQSLLHLYSLTEKPFKTWSLPAPGAEAEFDVTRPVAYGQWWVKKYYAKYELTRGEDALKSDLKGVKPALTGGLPSDYYEFFTTLRSFYNCYDAICDAEGIGRSHFLSYDLPTKSKDLAYFDNNDLLIIKKGYVSALISIFERTNLFKFYTPGQFLAASDEGKLNIAERESENESFQLLLITYVELRLDFENLLIYLKELAGMPVRSVWMDYHPQPVNPALEKAIVDFRNRHSDEELRKEYRKLTYHTPGKSWRDFLIECALVDSDFPETGSEGIEMDKERLKETLETARQRAKDAIGNEPGLLRTRVEKAIEILSAADRMATKYDCDIRAHEQVLRDYAVLLEEHMLAFPDLTKDAPAVTERLLSMMQAAFGAESRQTVGGNRLNGSVHAKLGHHQEAASYYIAAADMMARISSPDALWRGKDLRSAAVCYSRIPDYDKALVLFLQAATVFKQHHDEPRELEETYWNIAESYHQLKDKENEEKYRLLAAAIRTTDEI